MRYYWDEQIKEAVMGRGCRALERGKNSIQNLNCEGKIPLLRPMINGMIIQKWIQKLNGMCEVNLFGSA